MTQQAQEKRGELTLRSECRCASCGQIMKAGEPFEWKLKTFRSHAYNSGRTSSYKKYKPRHPSSVNCHQPNWSMPGGGYDQYRAALTGGRS